ncbi:hypothetical protein GCM10008995_01560 [Halobellus salinus]|uniref:Uncharacterized protein n=1 Tax=Halobellus salinus TaxID=931585 RepID=A0A830E6T8_9EURY|nr:transcriptional regulator [Halobellus salinus]GGI95094.1 hypothetical protein GCM10008995_01560 [Halobellus salinus]SMP20487.1 hypothetical protein SAMN06265347_107162 [Halobellus salinus]
MNPSKILEQLADDLASAVPTVDSKADHTRWQAGIGPFEENKQVEMLRDAVEGGTSYSIETEAPYLDGGQRVDLFIESEEAAIPVEAKLLRFRYDNGNIDPNSFAKVFSPFPEETTSTLLTDSQKLYEARFEETGGLLGLYYEPVDESYERMSPEAVAEKFALDVDYWYDFEVETRNVAHFDGLRHPVHQQGAVITWEIIE